MKTPRRKISPRERQIIRDLCHLSRDGWARATSADYEPLEKELREIQNRKG